MQEGDLSLRETCGGTVIGRLQMHVSCSIIKSSLPGRAESGLMPLPPGC